MVTVLGITLVSCGGPGASPSASSANAIPSSSGVASSDAAQASGAVDPSDLASLYEAAKAEGTLVMYTSAGTTAQAEGVLAGFRTAYPGIETQINRESSSQIDAKVQAEIAANNIKADIIETSSFAGVVDLFNKDMLLKNCTAEYDYWGTIGLPKGWMEPCYYYPYSQSFWFPVINTTVVSQADQAAMKDYQDILRIATEKKYATASGDVQNSGGWFNFYFALRSNFGGDWMKTLAATRPQYQVSNASLASAVSSGEVALVYCLADSTYYTAAQSGAPVEALIPASGVPSQPLTTASLKGAPHPNAAKLFQDWEMSQEGQTFTAKFQGSSVRPDVPAPEGSLPLDGVTRLSYKIDWTTNPTLTPQWRSDWVAIVDAAAK